MAEAQKREVETLKDLNLITTSIRMTATPVS